MRIGIYTRYAHCDEAYFAIRLADFLRSQDVECTIYSETQPGKLRVPYDSAVLHKKKMRYTAWARTASTIIWTRPPKLEQVTYAKRIGCTTLLAPMWQELVRPFRKVMQRFDHVIALTSECRELFAAAYKLKNVTLIPFDPGLPITKKTAPVDPRKVKILLPWFDRNARCANSGFLGFLGYVIMRMPDARVTIAVSSSKFAPAVAKFFSTLSAKTAGRVTLLRNVPLSRRLDLYTDHDLTFYPGECDNYGFCALTSLNCGTPVLMFNLSPQADFVQQDTNGVLVKTKVSYDENDVPHAVPDYERLLTALQTAIAEPWHIDNLNKRVNHNLHARRRAFELGWQTILRLV